MRIKFTGFVEVEDEVVNKWGLTEAVLEQLFYSVEVDALSLTFEKTEIPPNSTQE